MYGNPMDGAPDPADVPDENPEPVECAVCGEEMPPYEPAFCSQECVEKAHSRSDA